MTKNTLVESAAQYLHKMMRLHEGNPLAKMQKHAEEGRHFIAISTARPGLTNKEIRRRMQELHHRFREAGYGVRRAEGHYEGGKEPSFVVHAKETGRDSGAELVSFAKKIASEYDQDSILHHNGKTARLIGTNETGFPGKDKTEKVGEKLLYNRPEMPFQTEMKPSKKSDKKRFNKASARFTT